MTEDSEHNKRLAGSLGLSEPLEEKQLVCPFHGEVFKSEQFEAFRTHVRNTRNQAHSARACSKECCPKLVDCNCQDCEICVSD